MTAYLETGRPEALNFYGRNRVVVRNEPEFINVWDVHNGARKATLPSWMDIVESDPRPDISRQVRILGGNDVAIVERKLDSEGVVNPIKIDPLTRREINERDIWVNPHNLRAPVRLRWVEGNPLRRAFGAVQRLLSG